MKTSSVIVLLLALISSAEEECSDRPSIENELLSRHSNDAEGLEQIGDVLHSLRHYDRALYYHQKVFDIKNDVLSLISVATDLKKLHRYQEALDYLHKAPSAVLQVKDIIFFKASILDCIGQHAEAFKLVWGTKYSDRTIRDKLAVIEYLDHAIAYSKNDIQREKRLLKRDNLISKLTSETGINRHQLVPEFKKFVKSEKAVYDDWENRWGDIYLEMVGELKTWCPKLIAEFHSLQKNNLLERDDECIGTDWERYEVNPAWRLLPDDCSSSPIPTSCSLFKSLVKLSKRVSKLKIIRASFSTIPPHAHIRPHYGVTNGQLKFHLGLDIPGGNCASIRVNDTTANWVQGDVIMIDDSFNHEVWNNCSQRRTVFQVVVVHPDLDMK